MRFLGGQSGVANAAFVDDESQEPLRLEESQLVVELATATPQAATRTNTRMNLALFTRQSLPFGPNQPKRDATRSGRAETRGTLVSDAGQLLEWKNL